MRLSLKARQLDITTRDPIIPEEVANKNYVDNSINNHKADEVLHLTTLEKNFLNDITVSPTQINFLEGLTEPIQNKITTIDQSIGTITTAVESLSNKPMSMFGTFTNNPGNMTGSPRYLGRSITIVKLAAWLSKVSTTVTTVQLIINGTAKQNIEIPIGQLSGETAIINEPISDRSSISLGVISSGVPTIDVRIDYL